MEEARRACLGLSIGWLGFWAGMVQYKFIALGAGSPSMAPVCGGGSSTQMQCIHDRTVQAA